MKKLIVGLMASFLVVTGLVAFTAGPAAAECPYTACIGTDTEVNAGNTERGTRALVAVRVFPNRSGNAPVRGRLVAVIKRVNGGYRDVIRTPYTGPVERFRTEKLFKRGRYVVVVTFHPADNSIYKSSTGRDSFRVTRQD